MKRTVIIAALSALLAACGGELGNDSDCDDEKEDLVAAMGQPQEIEAFDSGSYHRHVFWYWRAGFSRSFIWTDDKSGCETSDYRFSPIR